MPQWKNKNLFVYHGTDNVSAGVGSISTGSPTTFSPKIALCSPNTDFGQGFYTTTRIHQAQQWANMKVLRTSAGTAGLTPVVLRFEVNRDWLAALDCLTFVRGTRDFWDLVVDCRSGFAPHQRKAPLPLTYDVVFGPVTIWQQTLTIHDCDQISFHSRRAAAGLMSPVFYRAATGPNNLF